MKRALLNTLILLVLLSVAFSVFAPAAIKNEADRYTEQGILDAIGVDIVLKSPGKEQANTTLAATYEAVEAAEPYYAFYCTVRTGSATQSEDVLLFDDFSGLEYTPYRAARMIEGEVSSETNAVIVDYTMAQRRGLSVGDEVWIGFGSQGDGVTFTVCAIVEDNPLAGENGSFAVQYAGTQKAIVEAARRSELQYSGVFLRVSEGKAELLETLKAEYLPMAEAPRREDFEYESEYDIEMRSFLEGDYAYLVEDVADRADLVLIEGAGAAADRNVLLLSIVAAVAPLLVFTVSMLLYRRRIRNELSRDRFIAVLRRYSSYFLPVLCILPATAITGFFATRGVGALTVYYPTDLAVRLLLPAFIAYAVAVLVAYAVNLLLLLRWRPSRG